MRNRALHDQLRLFADQAASRLARALESGSEIPFEVAEAPGARSILYRYRPLTDEFVRTRFAELKTLEAYPATVTALARVEGASAYLRVMGDSYVPALDGDRAEAVLRAFMARLWEESSSFDLEEPRFERAYRELEAIAYEDTAVNTVVAPVLGVRLASERWELGSGLTLVRGDLREAPPDAVWASGRDDEEPNTLVTLVVESTPKDPPPLTAARLAFRKLLTALRLFKPGSVTLGATAWWRTDEGPWQPVPLGFAGRSRGGRYWLEPSDRAELLELFEVLRSRAVQGGALPWALARFELGCEHPVALEGLSDHLLALRALFDNGERSDRAIARRMAALSPDLAYQAAAEERVQQAFKLERVVMRGDVDAAYLAALGVDAPEAIVTELEEDLRALLREMVWGNIDTDVRRVADKLLPDDQAEPPEAEKELEADPPEPDFVLRRRREASTDALLGLGEEPPLPRPPRVPPRVTEEPATEEHDWGFDDDPADYSAAV